MYDDLELTIGNYYINPDITEAIKVVGMFEDQFGEKFCAYHVVDLPWHESLGYLYPKCTEYRILISLFTNVPYEEKEIKRILKKKKANK